MQTEYVPYTGSHNHHSFIHLPCQSYIWPASHQYPIVSTPTQLHDGIMMDGRKNDTVCLL